MEYLDSVRGLTRSALDSLSRALYERDKNTFNEVLAGLTKSGKESDYETVAEMLATVPVQAKSGKSSFADTRFGTFVGDGYFNMYLTVCILF